MYKFNFKSIKEHVEVFCKETLDLHSCYINVLFSFFYEGNVDTN